MIIDPHPAIPTIVSALSEAQCAAGAAQTSLLAGDIGTAFRMIERSIYILRSAKLDVGAHVLLETLSNQFGAVPR